MNANATPGRRCDIVMKGGVTSGIVYPPAVLELAREFQFVNVGGTSAGAIAASLTAAAEYRRHNGGGLAGFERLAKVPEELATDGKLLALFSPNRATQLIFNELVRMLEAGSVAGVLKRFATLPFRSSKSAAALGIIALGVSIATGEIATGGSSATLGAAATVALAVAIGAVVSMYATMASVVASIVANGFGISTGIDETDPDNETYLGVWLGKMLDEIAGVEAGDHLTFGHLWYGRKPTSEDSPTRPADGDVPPVINLEMVSTCISHKRPYTFPSSENLFYYLPDTLKKYVHADIVEQMRLRPRVASDVTSPHPSSVEPYVRMPVERDQPVVLAVRMSLAFPILLSAVELGARSYDNVVAGGGEPQPEPCWFADGGLSSNFPVHMFDGPLPRWPTFAINLGTFRSDESDYYDDQSRNVAMPSRNGGDTTDRWSRFGSLPSYLGAMFNTIKDWNDSVQMKMPGFQDRIVTVKLRSSEGGLNLDMGPGDIAPLVARGRAAGKLLCDRFAQPSLGSPVHAMDWENHRIVRYRVAMSAGQRFTEAFARGYAGRQPGDASYDELLERLEETKLPAYAFPTSGAVKKRARGITQAVAVIWTWFGRNGVDFNAGSPQPQPDLVKRPRF